jgi:hypothetical protein
MDQAIPDEPYGGAKRVVELVGETLAAAQTIEFVSLRGRLKYLSAPRRGLDQQGILSSGANFGDMFYRLSWLGHLQILSEAGHRDFPIIQDGEPGDAVFKALAIVPMAGRRPGAAAIR